MPKELIFRKNLRIFQKHLPLLKGWIRIFHLYPHAEIHRNTIAVLEL